MKTDAYIGKLAGAGVDLRTAQAHGEALESVFGESYVTKDYLDAKLSELETRLTRTLIAQSVAIIGVLFALIKFVKQAGPSPGQAPPYFNRAFTSALALPKSICPA